MDAHCKKTKELKIISHTIKGVLKSDVYFTIPGVILITAFGLFAAIQGQIPVLRTSWIFWSIILFTISGIVFVVKVVPLQKNIMRMLINQKNSTNFDWDIFNNVYIKGEL